MEHSIDTIKQTPDTLPLPSVTKTYRLPEGMSLGPDESVKVKGFIARGRIDGGSAVLAWDDSGENDTQCCSLILRMQFLEIFHLCAQHIITTLLSIRA